MTLFSGAVAIVTMTGACSKPSSSANDDPSASSANAARVQAGLQLTRSGKVEDARVFAEKYLASSEGSPSSQERCKMLLISAFSYARLRENGKGETQLRTFASECKQYPLGDGWHMEAGRIRRLLDGENPEVVYRSSGSARGSSG